MELAWWCRRAPMPNVLSLRRRYVPLDVTGQEVIAGVATNDSLLDKAHAAYSAWLGVYKAASPRLGVSKPLLVAAANATFTALGCPAVPAVKRSVLRKIGLLGVDGLSVLDDRVRRDDVGAQASDGDSSAVATPAVSDGAVAPPTVSDGEGLTAAPHDSVAGGAVSSIRGRVAGDGSGSSVGDGVSRLRQGDRAAGRRDVRSVRGPVRSDGDREVPVPRRVLPAETFVPDASEVVTDGAGARLPPPLTGDDLWRMRRA